VKRFPHFRHSRRRRIDSASLLSRESTTLSFANPQKGHFMALFYKGISHASFVLVIPTRDNSRSEGRARGNLLN
jgi:hypothetical protein